MFLPRKPPGRRAGKPVRPYSTRQVTELLGISPARVRSLARREFLTPSRNEQGQLRFSFQDLVLLRTANGLLEAGIQPRRVWRALRAARARLPADQPLSSVRVLADGQRVLIRERDTAWEPESGQTILAFAVQDLAARVAPLVMAAAPQARVRANTSGEWFELALEFDHVGAAEDAEAAYREAIALDGAHVNARVNLGRLLHNRRAYRQAEELYRDALGIDPGSAIAAFNLGVVLEDQGALQEAMETYRHALSVDPTLPDVHYNLARLYEQQGDRQAALRHFASFRDLGSERES